MHVLTGVQMREADRRTIAEAGIPARVLMENAGRAVAAAVAREAAAAPGRRVLLFCGRGGNGGDGLVALRSLAARGFPATVVLLADPERLTGAAGENLETATRLGLDVLPVPDEGAWKQVLESGAPFGLAEPAPGVVVDALLGSGASGPLYGLAARVITDLDRLPLFRKARRVAVDIPSGLSADSGCLPESCFRADCTVALAAPKICHFVFPASSVCGRVEVAEIGIPRALISAGARGVRTNDALRVAALLPARSPGAHKGQLGRLLLVAGSRRMPGAAVLAAHGALAAGVGLLTVAGPAEALGSLPPEVMRLPLAAGAEGEITVDSALRIAEFVGSSRADAIAVGPGLGDAEETKEAARRIVRITEAPLVLDADGLNAWAGQAGDLAARPALALTPHVGEAARLLAAPRAKIEGDRLDSARRLAGITGNAVALKGPGTLIAAPDGAVFVNRSGGPELAAGGSGDVLTGVVGALLARKLSPIDALSAGSFLHGLAGEAAKDRYGEDAVSASIVASHLGTAIRQVRGQRTRGDCGLERNREQREQDV